MLNGQPWQQARQTWKTVKNTVLRCFGFGLAAIGLLGLVLPVLPGIPFLLGAALCFAAIEH